MRNIIFLWIISILFSSCYSYNPITASTNNIILGKKYKIETEKIKEIKAKVYKVNDSTLTLIKNEVVTEISFSEIEIIEIKKFSYWKTISISLGVAFIMILIIAILNYNPHIPFDIQAPN